MAEAGPMISSRTRRGSSYSSQWNRFVAWSEAFGKCSLPASPEDVAAYLEDRSGTGARPSTLRVAAAAIARNHRDSGYDPPVQLGGAEASLDNLMRDADPIPVRALPLNLGCYLARASRPRSGWWSIISSPASCGRWRRPLSKSITPRKWKELEHSEHI